MSSGINILETDFIHYRLNACIILITNLKVKCPLEDLGRDGHTILK
jgi:hypothetical protein